MKIFSKGQLSTFEIDTNQSLSQSLPPQIAMTPNQGKFLKILLNRESYVFYFSLKKVQSILKMMQINL